MLWCAAGRARAERYVVQPGETLEAVAARFHCSTAAVLRANKCDNVLVPAHTVVEIPSCGATLAARARTRAPHADASATGGSSDTTAGARPPAANPPDRGDPDALARAALAAIDGDASAGRTAGIGTAGIGTAGSGTADHRTSGSGTAGIGTAGIGTSGIRTAGIGTSGSGTAAIGTSDHRTSGVPLEPPPSVSDPAASESVGQPWDGVLRHGRALPPSDAYVIRRPARAFGADHAIAALQRAIAEVRAAHPDAPVLAIGDISAERGGPIGDHLSHQSGLDADVGFYFTRAPAAYPAEFVAAADGAFDAALNHALLVALLPHAQMIFLDYAVQARMYAYAASLGLPRAELARIFQYPRGADAQVGIVRHWPHHADHFHVRFLPRAR